MGSTIEELFDPYLLLHGFKNHFPWPIDPSANPYYTPMYYLICRLMNAKNILEIGLDAGYSSYVLGMTAKENGGMFFGVEKHEGKARRIKEQMDLLEIPNTIIWADSNDIEEWKWCDRLDFILLDGNHNVQSILHEMEILYPLIGAGGIVCIHDVWSWSAEGWAEVVKTYDFAGQLTFLYNFGLGILRKAYGREKEKAKELIEAFKKWQVSDRENTESMRTGRVVEL